MTTDTLVPEGATHYLKGTYFKHGEYYVKYYSKYVWKESASITNEALDKIAVKINTL